MTASAIDLPLWAAIAVSFFLLLGASLTLIGTIGFVKLSTFYQRIHAPTLGTSWGIGGVMLASMIYFSVSSGGLVVQEILVGAFVTLTTPVTYMLLARAALHRDRSEKNGKAPDKRVPNVDNQETADAGQ